MTDEELKALVAENSRAIREMREESDRRWQKFQEEIAASRKDFQEGIAASRKDFQEEIAASRKDFQEEIAASRKDLQEEIAASRKDLQEEIAASRKELNRALTSMSRTVSTVSRDIGRFHNRFGDYTEALCRPSLTQILRQRFHMTEIAPQVRAFRNGDAVELDMLAHANNELNEVYVAEIKTHLRQEGIDQILDHLRVFPSFFPEHRGKKLYGMLAAVEAPTEVRKKVFREGLYLMLVAGDVLEMRVPEGFEPRVFPTA